MFFKPKNKPDKYHGDCSYKEVSMSELIIGGRARDLLK